MSAIGRTQVSTFFDAVVTAANLGHALAHVEVANFLRYQLVAFVADEAALHVMRETIRTDVTLSMLTSALIGIQSVRFKKTLESCETRGFKTL